MDRYWYVLLFHSFSNIFSLTSPTLYVLCCKIQYPISSPGSSSMCSIRFFLYDGIFQSFAFEYDHWWCGNAKYIYTSRYCDTFSMFEDCKCSFRHLLCQNYLLVVDYLKATFLFHVRNSSSLAVFVNWGFLFDISGCLFMNASNQSLPTALTCWLRLCLMLLSLQNS